MGGLELADDSLLWDMLDRGSADTQAEHPAGRIA